MTSYVDTNVIISLAEEDENYERAKKIKAFDGLVTGEITVIELNAFYSRKFKDTVKARAATIYSLRLSNVKVVEVDWNRLRREAERLALGLQLKALDVLQIASAVLIGTSTFITFDKDIVDKKELVKKLTGIEVTDLQD